MSDSIPALLSMIEDTNNYRAFCTTCGKGIVKTRDGGWFTEYFGRDGYDYCEQCWSERKKEEV